jgi:pimeloyl-ACP methyl ester carboxylesterase
LTRFVFVHGAGCTGDVFAQQLAAFEYASAPGLPGHGDGLPGPSSIGDFANQLAGAIGNDAAADIVLCGSSMGGAIALEMALRHPLPLAGIVLLGSGARLRVAPSIFERLDADFPAAAQELARAFFARPDPRLVDAAVEQMLRVGKEQTIRDFRACDAFDATESVAQLNVPLLALTGERDVFTPPKFALWFADRVPGAEARILPDAGHLAMLERPEETNAALRAFVERIAPR